MSCRGFTLIELLVTLSLIAFSLSLSTFSMREALDRNSLTSNAQRLEGVLQFARQFALISDKAVTVCPSPDGQTCSDGDNYAAGWIVFGENPAAANSKRDAGETVVSAHPALGKPWAVVTRNLKRIRFLPSGNASFAGRLFLCSERDVRHRYAIVINPNGSVRPGNGDDHDCDA